MTIITALADESSIWLGNNNAVSMGETPITGLDPWLKFGDWALGVTGNSFQQDFLESNIQQLEEKSSTPLQLSMFIRTLFLDNYISLDGGTAGTAEFGIWCILVNRTGDIYDLSAHMSLTKIPKNRLWARGSGIDYALGADFATLQVAPKTSIKDRVRIATEAAIYNDTTCPGEVVLTKFV